MPFVRISVSDQLAESRRNLLPQAVYDAMRATIGIPENDFFVVLTPHTQSEFVFDPDFMGIHRTQEFVVVHITLRRGRTTEVKQALYREIARLFEERAQISLDNTMIVLAENDLADWSFGKGEAQYVLHPPAQVNSQQAHSHPETK